LIRQSVGSSTSTKGAGAMRNIVMALIGLSAGSFVLAAIVVLVGGNVTILGVGAEAFSRASNNIALIAIALAAVSMGWDKN
jgi:hypothetical protein